MSTNGSQPSGRAPTRGERTRAAILAATIERFRRQGFEKTTATEIADDAGVSQATVFSHFGSKNGLLIAVIEQLLGSFTERMEAVTHGAGGPRDRLRALTRCWVEILGEDWALGRILARHGRFAKDAEVLAAYREASRGVTRHFTGVLEDLRAVGEIRDDVPLALLRHALLGTSEYVMLGLALSGRHRDLATAADQIVDLVLTGAAPTDAVETPRLETIDAKLDQVLRRLG